jgi:hypothetical protein
VKSDANDWRRQVALTVTLSLFAAIVTGAYGLFFAAAQVVVACLTMIASVSACWLVRTQSSH